MKELSEWKIGKPAISVFCSGHSLENLTEDDVKLIKEKTFLITMNYAPLKYTGDMLVWTDKDVSQWLNDDIYGYRKREKDQLFLTKGSALHDRDVPYIKEKIDFLFDPAKFEGRFTVVWLFQILQRYFPDKKVYIFGMDMNVNGISQKDQRGMHFENYKWYDLYTRLDRRKNHGYKADRMLGLCRVQLEKFINNKGQFINCNPLSAYGGFAKIDNWKEIFNELCNS